MTVKIAQYAQQCPRCKERIEIGDEIAADPAGWAHARCATP